MDTTTPNFATLLQDAVTQPGLISKAYTAFHDFSLGNQLLAAAQCQARGIPIGPIATFPRWKDRGRFVRKGEKALMLCMPVTCKTKDAETGDDATFTRFVFKNRWFVLAQTDGEDFAPEPVADWVLDRALSTLEIQRIPFDLMDGNTQGYALGRTIAISPVAEEPMKTTLHEIAHIVLGHTLEHTQQDGPQTARNLREVEAESVAYLVSETLGLTEAAAFSRGYIQHWLRGETIPETSARKIFKTADAILRAGRPATQTADEKE